MSADFIARGLAAQAISATRGIGPAQATRILRGAQRGISPIGNVLGTPATLTAGTSGANSTIVPAATPSGTGARYPVLSTDTGSVYFTTLNGPLSNQRIRSTLNTTTVPGSRAPGHGAGIAFGMGGSAFDISLGSSSGGLAVDPNGGSTPNNVIIYSTDLASGVRSRVVANDFTMAVVAYLKCDFGAAALRLIEVYFQHFFYAINVAPTDSIWRVPVPDQPRIAIVLDSYGAGKRADTAPTNMRLAFTDYFSERLGCANPVVNAISGTGVLGTNVGANATFGQRIANGDVDRSLIGDMDLVYMPVSVNDGGQTDAAIATAYTSALVGLAASQPNAIIAGGGFQTTVSFNPSQARYDSIKAAFLGVAGGDPRFIYLDNAPNAGNWIFPGNSATYIGNGSSDTSHPKNALAAQYLGYRAADAAIAAIRSTFGF